MHWSLTTQCMQQGPRHLGNVGTNVKSNALVCKCAARKEIIQNTKWQIQNVAFQHNKNQKAGC